MVRPLPKRTYWIAFGTSLLLVSICFVFYFDLNKRLVNEQIEQTETVGNLALQDFQRTVRNNIYALENLKDRIEESEGAFMSYFDSDANRIMHQFSAIKFIEWIDSDGIIQRITPYEPNKAAHLLDLKNIEYRYDEWLHNSQNRVTNMTAWVLLTQSGKAFLVDVPMFLDGEFNGTVTAGMDFGTQFDKISESLKDHSIQIKDENGTVFYQYKAADLAKQELQRSFKELMVPVSNSADRWEFEMIYTGNPVYKQRASIQKIVLGFGVVLSIAISMLVFLFLKTRHNAKTQLLVNDTLQLLNDELEVQKVAAQQASSYKSDFLSNMSHEIRTPLNAILGFVDILQTKKLLKSEQLYLKLMGNSSQTLLGLVNDILDMDRIASGQTQLAQDVFQPSRRIQQVVKIYAPQIEDNRLQVVLHIEADEAHTVISDSPKFDQIITNLLTNAIKFTSEGTITISYKEVVVEEHLQISYSVRDTGTGIPEERLSSIFERFVQVDHGIKKRHMGKGLGLSIINELIHLLGGTIRVTSEVGKGSEFFVDLSLPLTVNDETATDLPPRDLSYLNALIIDDNRINRMILYNTLQQLGINADTAGSGADALDKIESQHFDVVFMDIHMPEMDGFEATEQILKVSPTTKILGVSADVTLEAIKKGTQVGMADYLTKPIDKKKLFLALHRLFVENEVTVDHHA